MWLCIRSFSGAAENLIDGTAALVPLHTCWHKPPSTSKGAWTDGALQAMIWFDEQLHSITIIYDVLLAALIAHKFDIHLFG